MDYQIISDDFNPEEFNTRAHHPLQSWEWGEARKQTGVGVQRIGAYDGQTLANVFTMTIHDIPFTPFKIGYIPRSTMPSEELLNYLTAMGKKHNLIYIKFEPYITKENAPDYLPESNFQQSPHPLFPRWTQMLDLTPTEEALMAQLKSKTRYNIRYAERNGVVVKEQSTDEGFEVFCDLYFKTTERQSYHGHTPHYHRIVWQALKQHIAHILIAYYHDTPLSAYELFYFKNRLYYPYGGSSPVHRNLMGSNLLMWEAIRLGKKLGADTFDMWGSEPPDYDRNGDWAGFTRFKEGYGTQFIEFVGSYDLVLNHAIYPLYNIAYQLRQKML